MAFNIENFKSNGLLLGGARPSLFEVQLTFPSIVVDGSNISNSAKFLIKASSLPASTLGEIDVSYFGRKIKFAGDRTFDDWSITVINDENFDVKRAFEEWSNGINTLVSNRLNSEVGKFGGAGINRSYKTDLLVKQYGKSGPGDDAGIIASYRIVGAFPTQISAITLDWDRNNTIEEFDVRIAYDYWVPEKFKDGKIYSPILSSP